MSCDEDQSHTQAYGMPPQAAYAGPPAHPGSYGQSVPGAQSSNLWIGFDAMPEFNIVQRLRGPCVCHSGAWCSAVLLRSSNSKSEM